MRFRGPAFDARRRAWLALREREDDRQWVKKEQDRIKIWNEEERLKIHEKKSKEEVSRRACRRPRGRSWWWSRPRPRRRASRLVRVARSLPPTHPTYPHT